LMYSLFTCLTAAAQSWWQVIALRFLVALGVGGEWAVASALVSEVFPPRARAWSGAIFHGSSVLGTYLAVAAGNFIVKDPEWGWRWAFAIGAAPALLTLWIRWQLREPDVWLQSRSAGNSRANYSAASQLAELFGRGIAGRTLLGFSLAVIGLATFWGVHIHGKELMLRNARSAYEQAAGLSSTAPEAERQAIWAQHERELKSYEMLGMFLTSTGGGLGLLAFGPICERLGRRWAFIMFHLGGLAVGLATLASYRALGDTALGCLLVVFGFWTLGMHAGYAIYFPELFPTRLRGLGAGFCFNFARFTTAIMLIVNGYLQRAGVTLESSAMLLSLLFIVGASLAWLGPETKGTELQ
jgi:Na+-transporting NADH:ubiquinone oxidoreductase subunit NqrB